MRLDAVQEIQNDAILTTIASTDPNEKVRLAAIARITDESFLTEILCTRQDRGMTYSLYRAAARRLRDTTLKDLAIRPQLPLLARLALAENLNDEDTLVYLFQRESDYTLRHTIVTKLSGLSVLSSPASWAILEQHLQEAHDREIKRARESKWPLYYISLADRKSWPRGIDETLRLDVKGAAKNHPYGRSVGEWVYDNLKIEFDDLMTQRCSAIVTDVQSQAVSLARSISEVSRRMRGRCAVCAVTRGKARRANGVLATRLFLDPVYVPPDSFHAPDYVPGVVIMTKAIFVGAPSDILICEKCAVDWSAVVTSGSGARKLRKATLVSSRVWGVATDSWQMGTVIGPIGGDAAGEMREFDSLPTEVKLSAEGNSAVQQRRSDE